jgi:outer membrane protein assembly factor BamD
MKRRILIFIFMLIFLGLSLERVYPYWIWTPKTGKWVNPKTTVRPSPKEQFDFAKSLFDIKSYEEAKREFKKNLRAYPKSAEAADSQYYLGLIEETQGDLYKAYQEYQKVIDKYPFSERIAEINEREYKIAEAFMSGAKPKTLGATLSGENPSLEIFTKIVENAPYGPLAAKAQYKLGLVLKGLRLYYEAEEAFSKVVTNYPESEWVQAAKFQIASTRAKLSKSPDYDQGATKEAKEKFEEFVKNNPDLKLSEEAEKNIQELKEKEAQTNYNIARFYEKQKDYQAARIYYNDIMDNHPASIWAARSLERIKIMEKVK